MGETIKYVSVAGDSVKSLGAMIPAQLVNETNHAMTKLHEALGGDIAGFVANRLQLSPEELSIALAAEQVDGVALAIYNIEARSQSAIIGDQTGLGKGRQAAAMVRYGLLTGYLPIFLTDRFTLFSDMYRDCKALGIKDARPLILNQRASIVDFDKPIDTDSVSTDEIWSPNEEADDDELMGLYAQQYEEVYKSPKKAEQEILYREGDIPAGCYEYVMLSYSQLKDAKNDVTRFEFLTSLCEKHRVLFIFDEAHKSSSVTSGKISIITQCVNSILTANPQTQCVFLSATFAKRAECLITFMGRTILSSLATNASLQKAFANGGVPMQEYVASMLAKEGQMIRRAHSQEGIPEPIYTYLDDRLEIHSELFDRVMYWFRELVKLSNMVRDYMAAAQLYEAPTFRPYSTISQLFYINKILLLALKAEDVAKAAVREVRAGRSVVIGMSDTLECVLRDYADSSIGDDVKGDFSIILLRLLDKTLRNPKDPSMTLSDTSLDADEMPEEIQSKLSDVLDYAEQIKNGIKETVFHLPMSPIDVIRQFITQEEFTDNQGIKRNIRFEECTGRARQLEYFSPDGDDDYVKATVCPRKKRHSNHIYNDFQNNKIDVILINACGAIGASAHAVATAEVSEENVRQRKMLIVQNDLDVNIDLQKRGRINRIGQVRELPPLYEYIITAIPSEKRLNMLLRAKLRSLSANTTANQDQDRNQADFVDITNKYGNLVAQDYIKANQELASVLGLKTQSTASQLLARLAMLSVATQQEIIDEVVASYLNLEQELRRINQWDLECEFRDFEAQFVRDELFTSQVDEYALGGASMLSTFRCQHRTYPYDAKTLQQNIESAKEVYGEKPIESAKLNAEIAAYYAVESEKIRTKFEERRINLTERLKSDLEKNNCDDIDAIISKARTPIRFWDKSFTKCLSSKQIDQLESYSSDYQDLVERERRELIAKDKQRKQLLDILSVAVVGQGFYNVVSLMPVDDKIKRVIAVLKEIRFGKKAEQRFLPGKVQLVFALSAVNKELILNLSTKGQNNNYDRLVRLLSSRKWNFDSEEWNREIAKYNNRIIERKIITGNILGAFSHELIGKINPRFISFTLAPDENGEKRIERGLLLPISGDNMDKLIHKVGLPLGDGLKYANTPERVFQISGIGIDFSVSPTRKYGENELSFYVGVNEKDSKKFESDSRFDSIREYFKPMPKQKLMRYITARLSGQSAEFMEIMTLLASLQATIMIPREYITVGEMKEYARPRMQVENSNWPKLDWRILAALPPVARQIQMRVAAPIAKDGDVVCVDEFSPEILLCQRTLAYHGRSFTDNTLTGKIRSLYFKWLEYTKSDLENLDYHWNSIACKVSRDLHRILVNSSQDPQIRFDDCIYKILHDEIAKYRLSTVGEITKKYRETMLFMSPSKEVAEAFLDSCLYNTRLAKIRQSLENYINGKSEIIK